MRREIYTARDGKKISVAIWDDVHSPKAVVQISHGMAEHIARYDDFAQFLNRNRFIAFGDDHRAHGETDKDALGLADGNPFMDTVSDLACLTVWAKERWELPVAFFGHSYGSFLGQEYLTTASRDIVGCILSGSALYGKALTAFGGLVSRLKKKAAPGKFFAGITFDSYDKKVGEGKHGWLSRDAGSNKLYADDPLSGFVCSYGFYRSFFKGMKRNAGADFGTVRRDLPLMIIYGGEDHVGGKGKLVEKLAAKYRKSGLEPKVKGYVGARHEILNETNKDEVYNDILLFVDSVV